MENLNERKYSSIDLLRFIIPSLIGVLFLYDTYCI